MAPRGKVADGMKTICLHGAESTGKSTLATQLGAVLGCEVVPEYGRAYCEEHGNEVNMVELIHIAEVQLKLIRKALARGGDWLIIDTDAITTAVWAQIMFGRQDPWFETIDFQADLYLLLKTDLPFVQDSVRVYGGTDERKVFHDLCIKDLDKRGCRYIETGGHGPDRKDNALALIRRVLG
jgi:NadR type nicotinamide-nucleotide adenylyltransferase